MTSYKTRVSSYGDAHGCSPGTRIKILADFETWAMDGDGSNAYWLVGMAGTGKSTISHTSQNARQPKPAGREFFLLSCVVGLPLIKLILRSASCIPIKIFVASRDEPPIWTAFDSASSLQQHFILHT
jgi:hypothetical protein